MRHGIGDGKHLDVCNTCRHGRAEFALSGHYLECEVLGRECQKEEDQRTCAYWIENKSGLFANERKHDYFSEEEFIIC